MFTGQLLTLCVDKVKLHDGEFAKREIVKHAPAVVILALDHLNRVSLVEQYRYACEAITIEFPAGCINEGESPIEAAKREFREECGGFAKQWYEIHNMFPAVGFCNEILHFFLATDLSFENQSLDDDERIECHQWSLEQLHQAIVQKEIIDMKTVLGYYLCRDQLALRELL